MKTQTQATETTSNTRETLTQERVNLAQSTIAQTVTATLLAAREAAQDVLKAYNREAEAKGAGNAAMVVVLYNLHLDGKTYVRDIALPNGATKEQEARRTIAIKLACADAGFTEFKTPEAKERSFINDRAKRAPQTMRTVAPLVLRMIADGVKPERNSKGLLKVPGRYLLTDDEQKDEANADILNKPLTLDYSSSEGATKYGFRKSVDRAVDLAAKASGVVHTTAKKTPAPITPDANPGAVYDILTAIRAVTAELASGRKHKAEFVAEVHTLYAAISNYLGACDETGKHVVPSVADMVLKNAASGK